MTDDLERRGEEGRRGGGGGGGGGGGEGEGRGRGRGGGWRKGKIKQIRSTGIVNLM